MTEDIYEVAARWHVAQQRDDMDWDAFVAWLEADPAHRSAYDAIALLDADIGAMRPALALDAFRPARAVGGVRMSRRWIFAVGTAAAAMVAISVGLGAWPERLDQPELVASREYASAPGTTRSVEVANGVTATLGAGSKLAVLAPDKPLRLTGSAFFAVRHDPARALTIEVAGYRIRDIGTRFSVNSAADVLSVAVEEGSIGLRAPGQAETIVPAGSEALAYGDGRIELRKMRAAQVATWRTGRFVYDGAPLALVAADISRYTGRSIVVESSASGRRFSGVIAAGNRDAMIATLTELTGLDAKSEGQTIHLVDRAGS